MEKEEKTALDFGVQATIDPQTIVLLAIALTAVGVAIILVAKVAKT